jgi:hypothetical protein
MNVVSLRSLTVCRIGEATPLATSFLPSTAGTKKPKTAPQRKESHAFQPSPLITSLVLPRPQTISLRPPRSIGKHVSLGFDNFQEYDVTSPPHSARYEFSYGVWSTQFQVYGSLFGGSCYIGAGEFQGLCGEGKYMLLTMKSISIQGSHLKLAEKNENLTLQRIVYWQYEQNRAHYERYYEQHPESHRSLGYTYHNTENTQTLKQIRYIYSTLYTHYAHNHIGT